MTCPSCAHENRPGAKFCEECAAPLKRACASCGAELRPTAKFCDECATPTGASEAPRRSAPDARDADTRKVVTIVFADLVGSTALHERLDAESARRFMESYYDAMRGAVEAHGGTVTQLLGDGVKAVFGIPRVAEDDAIRAVRAAVAMQDAFRALAERQRGAVGATGLRVAVNTGEVVANDATEIIGDPVNVAARLQEQGKDGDVVVGESTHRLVSALVTLELLGSFALKGRSEAVKAYRVVSLERPAGAATAPFVGRDDELARLTTVYETAIAKPAAGLAVLVGSPGLGKSRLIDEFARQHADAATVVQAHCDAAGGATFAPLAEALRERLAIEDGASVETLRAAIASALPADDADRARIAAGVAALLSGSPASPEETFFVVRRLLGALAQRKPVVLVIDDLHWAEPLLLDLVEHLVQWGSSVALFVLIGARPELRDLRSSLVTPGGLVSDVVTLHGLDAGAAMRLAANVIGASDLPAAIAAKVLATSEGNPLFVGELVRMLVQEGALTKEGDRWTAGANLAALEMPPTIHALLAARIERLRPDERTLLERAAVVGRHFSRSAVAALLPHDAGDLDARLEALRRSELIERDTGWLLGEPVLRFHHVLIRDAAYRRLLKGTRAELHAKLADWIEAQVGDAPEHDETIGWHLEQAHAFLRELGPLDANGTRLGGRAASRLAAAGRRALGADDVPLAASLLGRAIERLDTGDPARADLALDWCEALLSAGDVVPAADAIAELGRFAASDDRLRAWHTCYASQLTVLTAPQELQAAADAVAGAAQQLTAQGDAAGAAKAHSVHAQALARLGKVAACEAALDLALAAARRAGDRRRANAVLAGAPLAALWGPSPVTRASGRCLDVVRVLRITQGAPAVEAVALSCQGVLEALRGRTEAARRMLASSRKMVEELGIANRLFEADVFAGRIEAMEGETAAAERLLRGAYEGLRDLGLGIDAARAGALLARTLLEQDRIEEAEALSHESERLAGDDLQAAIAWRGVRAEALARRGEHAAAIELAKVAVAIASATDALLDHAGARMALAAALRAAGRSAEADAEERRAIELWEAKGATLLAARARRTEAPVAAADAPPARRSEPRLRRRIASNAAIEAQRRFEALVAAGNFDALRDLLHASYEEIDHPTGSIYGRDEANTSIRALFRSRDPHYEEEPLATLGDALALRRRRVGASGTTGRRFDVGEYQNEAVTISEVDASGCALRQEVFAADRLGEAIARLYARHAELLPEGPERERAAAVARSLGTMSSAPNDFERVATVLPPDFESVDHRHLSTWSLHGGDAFLAHMRALHEVADDVAIVVDEVLALEPSALLVRRMHSGTERLGGGAYERPFLVLFATDADGRLARAEWFDADREAEAIARFEAFVAGAEPKRIHRRPVRPNAATRSFERFGATLAARDRDALAQHFDESMEIVHHPSGLRYGRREMLATWRSTLKAERFEFQQQILASLGDTLALDRHLVSVEGLTEAHLAAFGHAEFDEISLLEVDDRGRWLRSEIFAADRLGEALARFYERHAEQLPAGPERERSVAAARSFTVFLASRTDGLAPAVEFTDHRLVGPGTLRGPEAVVAWGRSLHEAAESVRWQIDDVLALSPDQHLVRSTSAGIARDGGGAFERTIWALRRFGADGRITNWEIFDADREAEALARFDALAGGAEPEPTPDPFANAASRADRKLFDCFNARDWAGIEALAAPDLVFDERRRMVRNTCGRDVWLEQFRVLFDVPASRFTTSLLATRGERLALSLHRFEGEVAGGGGPLAMDDHLVLHEVDPDGRIVAIVLFDLEDRNAAYAELDARFEVGEAAACPLVHWSLTNSRLIDARDWQAYAAGLAPGFVYRDHRMLGWGDTGLGAEGLIRVLESLFELSSDARYRHDHVRIAARGVLRHTTLLGTREGGAFENPMFLIAEVDQQGRTQSTDTYDIESLDRALARFAEIAGTAAATEGRFENAASRAWRVVNDAWQARDAARFEALHPRPLRYRDRRRLFQLDLDRAGFLDFTRPLLTMRTGRASLDLLATRGERLALMRSTLVMADESVGPSAIDSLMLIEADERGAIAAYDRWDLEDLDAAYAELDARWGSGEGRAHASQLAFLQSFDAALTRRDWDAVATGYAPEFVGDDHRLVSWGTLHGAAFVEAVRELVALAPDVRLRWDHLRMSSGAMLAEAVWIGTRDGGAFESPFLLVSAFDAGGKSLRSDFYDPHHLERARERFEALRPAPSRIPPNAATRVRDRQQDAFIAREWDAIRALAGVDFEYEDRGKRALVRGNAETWLTSMQFVRQPGFRAESTPIGTIGDRVALDRLRWFGAPGGDAFEWDRVRLLDVGADGRLRAAIFFDSEDRFAASIEGLARFAAGEAAGSAGIAPMLAFARALGDRDWDAARECFAPDLALVDHRPLSFGALDREQWIAALRANDDLSVGLTWDVFCVLACSEQGFVVGIRRLGTIAGGGGPFENELFTAALVVGGRIQRYEFFGEADAERAVACFKELCAQQAGGAGDPA